MAQRIIFWIGIWLAATASLGMAASEQSTSARLTISNNTTVQRSTIYLGDVARIQAGAPELTTRLARVPLGSAPAAGQRRRIPLSHIERSLTRSGFDVGELDITSPEAIIIARAASTITKEQLEKIAANYLRKRLANAQARITVRAVRGARGIDLPKGQPVRYSAHATDPLDIRRPVPVKITFHRNNRVVRSTWVTVDLSVMTPVLVAVRPIARYQPISATDIRVEEREIAGIPSGILIDPSQAIGKRAVRMIPAGTPLVERLVDLPALIRRGDIVQIIAEQGPLRIIARGEARRNGRRGERIPVRNLDSRKQIMARVVDAQTVHVEF